MISIELPLVVAFTAGIASLRAVQPIELFGTITHAN